jgi:1-acyl-sn-glycerol-3-phosphate acyltransferase
LAVVSAASSEGTKGDLLTGTLHGRARTILRAIVLALLRPLLALRLIGEANVPCTGPLLVASNHLSTADPIILEAAFPRPLFFVGKSELFRNPVFRWILHRFGGIPVERGTPDRAAIRRARAVLEQGIALAIYPEGVRSRTVALLKGLPGAGLIALQSGAPVLPVGIYGTEFFPVNGEMPPRRPKNVPRGVTVRFGSPFRIPERVDGKRVTAEEATHLIMVRIAALLPERYHGVYASDGNWQETVPR